MPDTTTQVRPSSPSAAGEEGERILLALAGEPERYCMHCGKLLTGENDGWAHPRCAEVVETADKADEVHDNGPLEKVERKLRRKGKCPHQIRAPGWDGGGIYCGREITEHGDYPARFCLEHECEASGDEEGALQERTERTEGLLAAASTK